MRSKATLIALALGSTLLGAGVASAQTREDDREEVRDRREDRRDRTEDRRDAWEDRRDRAEDRRDRAEDRREDRDERIDEAMERREERREDRVRLENLNERRRLREARRDRREDWERAREELRRDQWERIRGASPVRVVVTPTQPRRTVVHVPRPVRAELALHAQRMAELERIHELSQRSPARLARVDALIRREMARHSAVMRSLGIGTAI